MERESGPGRGGLFLCRLQPLTQCECLLLCHAASHSGSSWRMTADIIVPPACSRNSTGRAYLTIRSPDWLQHYRGKDLMTAAFAAICRLLTQRPAAKVRFKQTASEFECFLIEATVNVFKDRRRNMILECKKQTNMKIVSGLISQQYTSLYTRWHW